MTEIRLYKGMGFDGNYQTVDSNRLVRGSQYVVRFAKQERVVNGSELQSMITRRIISDVVDVAPIFKNGGKRK